MPRAAVCPQCDVELFIPDEADRGAWAQCPSCQAVFDLQCAAVRPLAEVALIDAPPAVASADETLAEFKPLAAAEPSASDESAAGRQEPDEPPAAEKIAAWFRSEPTVADVPPLSSTPEPPQVELSRSGDEPAVGKQHERSSAEEHREQVASAPGAVTLADLMPRSEPADATGQPVPESRSAPPVAGSTVEYMAGSLPAASRTDFELDDLGRAPSDPQTTFPESALGDEAEFSPDSGCSEDTERLERLLADVETQMPAGASSADSPDEVDRPAGADEPSTASLSAVPRRKRSAVRRLASITLGGVLALAGGYYLLLVMGGPDADALQLARYVPPTWLPASFQSEPAVGTPAPAAPATSSVDQVTAADDSAEVPASFVTPVEPMVPLAGSERYADDRSGGDAAPSESPPAEPSRFDQSAALPLTPVTPHVVDAPSYTTDELQAALAAARKAQTGLVSGDLNDPAVRRTKGLSYAGLCELAEVLTYADAGTRSDEAALMQQEAEQLFGEVLAGAGTRAEVARIVPIWIDSPNRRHGGVFLAGRVIGRSVLGDVEECQLDMGQGPPLTILVASESADALDATDGVLGIVGTIVESPGERVAGYTGSAPRAVWVHCVLRLP